jgi:hypothetical protein
LAPATLLSNAFDRVGGEIMPRYLTEQDYPWLRAVLDEYERHVGCRRAELDARLAEPLVTRCPKAKLRSTLYVIDRLARTRMESPLAPRKVRALAFRAAAAAAPGTDRARVLEEVATRLGANPADVDNALFADLPGEQRVRSLGEISPNMLAREVNAALVGALLGRARTVRVQAWGKTRAVVRHAKITGLLCVVRRDGSAEEGVVLDISGPFSLFRRTDLYRRALSSLLPRLAWCERYELRAHCELPPFAQRYTLIVQSGDPIAAGRELPRYDSKLEERFARELSRLALEWDLVREPLALEVGGALIFPDFELRHRRSPERRWLLEIVGFWTPEYVTRKLATLAQAGITNLILCIDEKRSCAEGDLPAGARVVRYRKRIDPREVLAIVEGAPSWGAT